MSANFNGKRLFVFCAAFFAAFLFNSLIISAQTRRANQTAPAGKIEQVFAFQTQMLTGVTVSQKGRIFVNYPRWEDKVDYTVAEIVNGREVPFPDAAINRLNLNNSGESFVSVQSVVIDPNDRLWILDTGSINLMPIVAQNAPKLVCVDLATNKIVKTIKFTPDAVLPTTYLNDIRFDLRKGAGGTAYITDSSSSGPNALLVVDLASGQARRVLSGHPSVSPEPLFTATVEGKDLKEDKPDAPPMHIRLGVDGIAISADGSRIYYCPLASRKLYSVSTDALLNPALSETELAAAVRDEGAKPAADGLESDAQGNIYVTDYENRGIKVRNASGAYETLVEDPKVVWADTMSVAPNGFLYFTSNQLNRQAGYNNGQDLRKRPYHLFRLKIAGTPIRLK